MVGVFGCPTVVNNVETLASVPHIVDRGGEWFAGIGTQRSTGTKLFSVSGHVERPRGLRGPMGITFREIIEDICGGVKGGKRLKAFIPADPRVRCRRRTGLTSVPTSSRWRRPVPCSAPAG